MEDRYMALMGLAPERIPHWEHWSCPDAESYITGIDYYQHPKQCRDRMRELYPCLELPPINDDSPKARPGILRKMSTPCAGVMGNLGDGTGVRG